MSNQDSDLGPNGNKRRFGRRGFLKQTSAVASAWAFLGGRSSTAIAQTAKTSGQDIVVETTFGKIRGRKANGISAFKGVPYGASTAGANRFMPPKKPIA